MREALGSAPTLALAYLILVTVPLALWANPGVSQQPALMFAASLVLFVGTVTLFGPSSLEAPASSPLLDGVSPLHRLRTFFALGALFALTYNRFRPNELSGILLLFAPLSLALALAPARGSFPAIHRAQAALLTLLFVGLLLATGSRGGLVALLLASILMLFAGGRWWLGISFVIIAVLSGFISSGPIDWLLYDGKVQGLTLDSMLTGRPELWRRALHAIADFPWTGLGIGLFRDVVGVLYYPSSDSVESLEDAHSLLLQTALDLGIPGLLAFLILLAGALRRIIQEIRRSSSGSSRHAYALGLFGSLTAFGLFNVADAIALGTVGSLPFFFLLGLLYATQPVSSSGTPLPRAGYLALAGVVLLLLMTPLGRHRLALNCAALLAAESTKSAPELLAAANQTLDEVGRSTCRANWLAGKLAANQDELARRDASWSKLVSCSSSFVTLVAAELPLHRPLATAAVEAWPNNASAHLWLARVHVHSREPAAAERRYRQSLVLEPTNGLAWLELGRLVAPRNPWAALQAFAQSCRHGDPGANGCAAAGATAESLGDVEGAIHYGRQSRWASARERADRLKTE